MEGILGHVQAGSGSIAKLSGSEPLVVVNVLSSTQVKPFVFREACKGSGYTVRCHQIQETESQFLGEAYRGDHVQVPRALRRPEEVAERQGGPFPVQEHVSKRQCGQPRSRSSGIVHYRVPKYTEIFPSHAFQNDI